MLQSPRTASRAEFLELHGSCSGLTEIELDRADHLRYQRLDSSRTETAPGVLRAVPLLPYCQSTCSVVCGASGGYFSHAMFQASRLTRPNLPPFEAFKKVTSSSADAVTLASPAVAGALVAL